MSRYIAIFTFLAGLIHLCSYSQVVPEADIADLPLRIEIPAQSVNETYKTIPVGKTGMIIYYRSLEIADQGKINWYFALYDTNLQQVWVKPVPIPQEHNVISYDHFSDTLAMLFVPAGKSKSSDDRFEILRIIPKPGILMLNTGKSEAQSEFVDFSIRNDRAWIGVNLRGQPGKIITIKLNSGVSRDFALGAGSSLSVKYVHADSVACTVTAVVSRQMSKKNNEYFFVSYDTLGKLLREVMIGSQADERVLTNFRIRYFMQGTTMVAGSYCQGTVKSTQKDDQYPETTGLFCCIIKDGKQQACNFYNFLEFKNAESFIGEKDVMNLKKKALKKNKSLNEYSLDFQVVMHELMSYKGQFLLTSEVYAPQYHSETFTDFDFYGRPYTNSYSVFDGYRYSNAIIASFNENGNLVWDNTIELRNFLSMELRKNVVCFPSGSHFVLLYSSEGMIGSKIISENSVIEKTDFSPIDLMYPEDKLVTETKGKVQYWYGNFFIVSGFQEIKNIAREAGNKRLVFYFSKLQFTP
jgi:hypothetical protein